MSTLAEKSGLACKRTVSDGMHLLFASYGQFGKREIYWTFEGTKKSSLFLKLFVWIDYCYWQDFFCFLVDFTDLLNWSLSLFGGFSSLFHMYLSFFFIWLNKFLVLLTQEKKKKQQ